MLHVVYNTHTWSVTRQAIRTFFRDLCKIMKVNFFLESLTPPLAVASAGYIYRNWVSLLLCLDTATSFFNNRKLIYFTLHVNIICHPSFLFLEKPHKNHHFLSKSWIGRENVLYNISGFLLFLTVVLHNPHFHTESKCRFCTEKYVHHICFFLNIWVTKLEHFNKRTYIYSCCSNSKTIVSINTMIINLVRD